MEEQKDKTKVESKNENMQYLMNKRTNEKQDLKR